MPPSLLEAEGIELGVVDMYSIAPIDTEAIRRAASAHGVVITAEEHNLSSGFGSAVAEVIAEEGLSARLVRIGVPDEYSLLGPPTHLYRHYGLDAEGVAASVRKAHRADAAAGQDRHRDRRRQPARTRTGDGAKLMAEHGARVLHRPRRCGRRAGRGQLPLAR